MEYLNFMTLEMEASDSKRGVVQWGGSFLFGAVGYATLIAIPLVYGPVIREFVESEIASLLLFSVLVVLAVAFLYLSGVKLSVFLIFAVIGAFTAYASIWIFFGPSPVFSVMFFALIGVLVIGSMILVIILRKGIIKSLMSG